MLVHPPAHFYPRSPRGERRAASRSAFRTRLNFYPRSPRGERRLFRALGGGAQDFYPRSPRGERPNCTGDKLRAELHFYPRSPRGERPERDAAQKEGREISIHAPREGSDRGVIHYRSDWLHFYPRSPRGERQESRGPFYTYVAFLSTLPARGATAKPNKNTAGFCAKGPNADLGCTKRESQFCAFSIIFLRAGAVRRGFAGANLPVGPCALGLRTGGGRRPDYTSSTSSWDHCGARPMCSTRVL